MNEWRVLVLAIGMAVAFVAGTRWDAAKVVTAEKALVDYKYQEARKDSQARIAQQQQRALVDAAAIEREKAHAQTLQDLQENSDRLSDRLRRERVRNVCTRTVPTTAQGNSGQPATDSGGGELSEAAGSDLVRLARDADQVVESLRQCQADQEALRAIP